MTSVRRENGMKCGFRGALLCALIIFMSSAAGMAAEKGVLFFGVYTQWYEFDEALAQWQIHVSNAHSERVQDFPSLRDLMTSDIVILSSVSGNEFTPAQVAQIKGYVQNGGRLLVTGGPYSLGLGSFTESGLAELLPVRLQEFDLRWIKEGTSFKRSSTADFDLSGNPKAYWIHDVKPKQDADVLLTAGDLPLLICGRYGKGRVTVFTATPMGIPAEGETPFWEWSGWHGFLQAMVSNLAGGK